MYGTLSSFPDVFPFSLNSLHSSARISLVHHAALVLSISLASLSSLTLRSTHLVSLAQMHYNTGGFDLFTYMTNPEVFAVKSGAISLLTGPGLGVELDEELIRSEAEKAKELEPWQNPVFRGDDGAVREW